MDTHARQSSFPTQHQIDTKLFREGIVGVAREARNKLDAATNKVSVNPRELTEAETHLAQARRWLDALHNALNGQNQDGES